jgi:hypothetical protein
VLGPKQFLELQGGHNDGFVFMREEWVRAVGGFWTSAFRANSQRFKVGSLGYHWKRLSDLDYLAISANSS